MTNKLEQTNVTVSHRHQVLLHQILNPDVTMSQEKIPKEFICPLGGQMLNVPIVNQHGISYEEDLYRSYIALNKKDPLTGKPIVNFEVYTNFSLIDAIDEFLAK